MIATESELKYNPFIKLYIYTNKRVDLIFFTYHFHILRL